MIKEYGLRRMRNAQAYLYAAAGNRFSNDCYDCRMTNFSRNGDGRHRAGRSNHETAGLPSAALIATASPT